MKKVEKILAFLIVGLLIVICSCSTTKPSSNVKTGGSINRETGSSTSLKKVISVASFTTTDASSQSDYDVLMALVYAESGMVYQSSKSSYAAAAYETLVNELQGTGKFIIFEESQFDELNDYIRSTGNQEIEKRLAQYMLVGNVNSVSKKTDTKSFLGIKSNTTIVEASVTIRLIDTRTGQVIYAEEGQGDSSRSKISTIFNSNKSGYDNSSLEKIAISAAVDSLIENIVLTCDQQVWTSSVFNDGNGNLYLLGGESVGIREGNVFDVYKKGDTIVNPQTGSLIELPGQKVADATVLMTFPANLPEDEVSMIAISNGEIDINMIEEYVIREKNR